MNHVSYFVISIFISFFPVLLISQMLAGSKFEKWLFLHFVPIVTSIFIISFATFEILSYVYKL